MYKFTPALYTALAEELTEKLRSLCFFSGSVEFESDDADIRFVATLILYFRTESFPEGLADVLDDVVPVWWELHTTTLDGEVINDFDFDTFKHYLCQC